MKRPSQTASFGASRGQQALNQGFAIFQREEQTYKAFRSPSQIVIRTLPFIKRKQTEDLKSEEDRPNLEVKAKLGIKELTYQDDDEFQTRQTEVPNDRAASTMQSRMSKSQVRFYVHQVGSNFSSTCRNKKLDTMRTTFGSGSKFRQSEDSPLQSPLSMFQSTNNDRYLNRQNKQVQIGANALNQFTETQKQFFENFMQETPPIFSNDIPVLSDQEIKDDFAFTIPIDVQSLENPGSSVSFLNGFPHNFPLIMNHYKAACRVRDDLSDMKEGLKKEIEDMKKKFDKEIEDFQEKSQISQSKIAAIIREDFVKHQTEQFSINKELTKVLRDKIKLESDIDDAMVKIRKLEDKLYGREIFNVETNAPGFMNITSQNLREDIFSPLSSKRSQFFNKNVIH